MHTALGEDALALLDDEWDALLERQAVPNPLLSAAWLRALAQQEPGTPLVATVSRGSRLLTAGAFALRRVGQSRRLGVATWLGAAPLRITPDLLADPDDPARVTRAGEWTHG